MKKRGDISLWFLVEFIGAFLIAFLAVDISINISQQRIYEKLNIAKDLAMQINALTSISGEAYIANKNLHGYSLYFNDNRIEVFDDDFDQVRGIYYFVNTGATKIDSKLNKPKQVIISKINNEIKISEEIPVKLK